MFRLVALYVCIAICAAAEKVCFCSASISTFVYIHSLIHTGIIYNDLYI
jgi:hypothetical protein